MARASQSNFEGWQIWRSTGGSEGKLNGRFYDGSASRQITSTSRFDDNAWHLVMLTNNGALGADGTMELFTDNGNSEGTDATAQTNIAYATSDFIVADRGSISDVPNLPFKGCIGYVMVTTDVKTGNYMKALWANVNDMSSFWTVGARESFPDITGVSPSNGSPAGGTSVTITGGGFGDTQGSGTVTFGGTEATAYASWSDTEIVCTTPAGSGDVDVVVTSNDNNSDTDTDAFQYNPIITSILPNVAMTGNGITILGDGFMAAQGSGGVTFGGVAATIISWADGLILCTAPAGEETVDVVVTNDDGDSVTSTGGFTYLAGDGGMTVNISITI